MGKADTPVAGNVAECIAPPKRQQIAAHQKWIFAYATVEFRTGLEDILIFEEKTGIYRLISFMSLFACHICFLKDFAILSKLFEIPSFTKCRKLVYEKKKYCLENYCLLSYFTQNLKIYF